MTPVTDTAFQLNQHIDLIKFQPFYATRAPQMPLFSFLLGLRGSSIKNAIDMRITRNCIIYAKRTSCRPAGWQAGWLFIFQCDAL